MSVDPALDSHYGLYKPLVYDIAKQFDRPLLPGIVEIRLVSAKFKAVFSSGLAPPGRGHGMATMR